VALVFLGLAILAFVSWIFGIMMAVAGDLPELEDRAQFARAENSVVYDAYNNKIATLTNNQGRVLIPSADIAPVMKEATVAIEDERFYEHRGVDFQGIGRAVVQDILHTGAEQGGSTITQQFVKNALRAQGSRTVFQKLREAALAYHLERQWPKDKILTQYLNSIYFGQGAYGIEAAARTFFGWNHVGCGQEGNPACASELLPWEAATLAGMLSNPTGYDPRTNPEGALARRNLVLQKMVEQGYITSEDYTQYAAVELPAPSDIKAPEENSKAPYFTSWLRQQLVDLYGAGEAFGGGLQIRSTLDLALQERVQEIAASHVAGLGPSAAVVVLDNATGGVRAMLGGFDYEKQPFNLATQGHRQPGSAFKPFTLVTALEQGRSPSEVFTSAAQEIPFKAKVEKPNGGERIVSEIFPVKNYNDSYLGSASIATGTTYSDNSVYSQLGTQVGPANVAETANEMGIETDLSVDTEYSINDGPFEPYNPALILGGLATGVSPLEMAHAYETLAHNGQRVSGSMTTHDGGPVGILKVTDGPPCSGASTDGAECGPATGDLVKASDDASGEDEIELEQVISPEVAATARSILQTVVSQGTGELAATGDDYIWGKTGTTDNNGDAWFVGATKEVTVAVWVGFPNDVKPMLTLFNGGPVDGGTIPALVFRDVIAAYDEILAERDAEEAPTSSDETSVTPTYTTPAPTTTTPAPAPAPEPTEPPAQPSTEPPSAGTGTGDASPGGGTAG
jgi:penicillin-binding protein 1A